jgi:hypothetical protein
MFKNSVDIKYAWIFYIFNSIGVIISLIIAFNNKDKVIPILITILFILSLISYYTDNIYFYTVNGFCLALIVAYIIYVYKNKKEIIKKNDGEPFDDGYTTDLSIDARGEPFDDGYTTGPPNDARGDPFFNRFNNT